MQQVETAHSNYNEADDVNIVRDDGGVRDEEPEMVFKAGQSKRIWNELYKAGRLKSTGFPIVVLRIGGDNVEDGEETCLL